MKKIISKLCKHKKLLLSLLLFGIVFVCLGLPYTHWWFNGGDDFHGVYVGFKTKTIKELFYFFIDGNVSGKFIGPSNYDHHPAAAQTTFFGAYYRPLYLVFATLQYWLFGTNGYAYLLCNVFVHAINTVLLFNLFSLITSFFTAFLASLLFAFHPQIAYRFGATINLHYYINVMFMLLTIISFKRYLDTQKIFYHLAACALFAIALFTRESSIVLPGIIFLGTYLYPNDQTRLSIKHFFSQFFSLLKQTYGLLFVALAFLALRAYLYPITFNHTPAAGSVIQSLIAKSQELLVFIYDSFWLSWLPWGHKLLRGSLMLLLITLCLWLFIKNTKKIFILYFLFCTALILWPAYIGCYSPRYIYEAMPFIIAAFIVLFQYTTGNFLSNNTTIQASNVIPSLPSSGKKSYDTIICHSREGGNPSFQTMPNIICPGSPPPRGRHHSSAGMTSFKTVGLCLLSIYTLFLITFAVENFYRREQKMAIFSGALHKLVAHPAITNHPLCLLSYPADGLGDNPTDIMRVLLQDLNKQIYCDSVAALVQASANIVSPVGWRNMISLYYTQNYVQITPTTDGFRFTSLNPQKIIFYVSEKNSYSLGEKIVHQKDAAGNVIDFTLAIDQQYLNNKPIFVYWDYEKKAFVLLEKMI